MGRTGDKIEVVTYDSLDIKGVYSLEWGGAYVEGGVSLVDCSVILALLLFAVHVI